MTARSGHPIAWGQTLNLRQARLRVMAALARSHSQSSHSRSMGGRHKAGHDGI
jgi:hypothetical protein